MKIYVIFCLISNCASVTMAEKMSTDSLDDFERLKGQTKAESLFTKPPLINPSTMKRQDGRGPKDVRHICK